MEGVKHQICQRESDMLRIVFARLCVIGKVRVSASMFLIAEVRVLASMFMVVQTRLYVTKFVIIMVHKDQPIMPDT